MPKASPLGRRADRRVVPIMPTVGGGGGGGECDDYSDDDDGGDYFGDRGGATVRMVRGVPTPVAKKPLLTGSLRASAAAAGKAVMDLGGAATRPPPLKLPPPPGRNKPAMAGTLRAKHSTDTTR